MEYGDLMIPAQESLFRDQIMIEREQGLAEYMPLILFATYADHDWYEDHIRKLAKKYNRSKITYILWEGFLDMIIDGKDLTVPDNPELSALVTAAGFTANNTMSEVVKAMIDICVKYSKQTNSFTVIQMTDFLAYSYREMPTLPVMMMNLSRMKAYMKKYISPFDPKRKLIDTSFNRAFSTKIDRRLFVRWTPKLELFHVSVNLDLKELEPRVTHRPLNAQENMRIPRISCAPTVDGCFRGAQFKEECKVRVYQLLLNKDSLIVRPDTYLVPDRDTSDEYWVLTKTKVKPIALIHCIPAEDDKGNPIMRFVLLENE